MAHNYIVPAHVFDLILYADVGKLQQLNEQELRQILPCLVRMGLCAPADDSNKWKSERKTLLQMLSSIDLVNGLVALLSVDFNTIRIDAKKEKQLRAKVGGSNATESVLVSQLDHGIALEFERSDPVRKLRLVLSELLFVMAQIQEPRSDFYFKNCELFDCEVYLDEVIDVIVIAQAELPALLPMCDVVEALLHMTNGMRVMSRLIANAPYTFNEVCCHLVSNGEKQEEEVIGGRKRMQALNVLCEMNPSQAFIIRDLCIEHCRMPGLAVTLTLQMDSMSCDLVALISGLLLGEDPNTRSWFSQFIKNGQKRKRDPASSSLHQLRERLLSEVKKVSENIETDHTHNEGHVITGSALIRVYCAMKAIATLKFSDDEVVCLLRLITSHPAPSCAAVRFVSLALSMFLACPNLIGNVEHEKTAKAWIRWLIDQESHFAEISESSDSSSSYGEMLLLVAIHFHNNQIHAISDLVCSTLGMKSAVKSNTLTKIKIFFTQEIFTDKVVTAHAVRVAVTPGLNSTIPGFLPVHCVYQLLKGRAFSKHKVPIKGWIYRQIRACHTPVHPLLPPLIETYVLSIITPSTKSDHTHTNKPITEQEIMEVFKDSVLVNTQKQRPMDCGQTDKQDNFTSQLLLMYYILLYQDTRLANMKAIVSSNRKVLNYSDSLLSRLPFKYLLQRAQKQPDLYGGLIPHILRLMVSHYPHLCVTQDWLEEDIKHCDITTPLISPNKVTSHLLMQALENMKKNPTAVLLQLETLVTLSAEDLVPFADVIVSNLLCFLEPGVPRKLLELVRTLLIKLNSVMPRSIRVMFVNALRDQNAGAIVKIAHTEDNLTVDPLTVLRCDDRVLRCPPLLDVTLRILSAYLQASRTFLSLHIQTNPVAMTGTNQSMTDFEREELKNALIAAQESAVVQILLETCLPKPNESNTGCLLSNLREVQCIVCSHVHQMFISDPNLAKLVHFQGYPSELIAVTVTSIPSMHICLDFIPELLSQPQTEKQVFAVQLTSHLCLQYALPKSLGIAKLAINVLSTLLTVLSHEMRPDFYIACLPSLIRISKAFPPLHEEIHSLLTRLGRICSSHMSSMDTLTSSETSHRLTEGDVECHQLAHIKKNVTLNNKYYDLYYEIHKTFSEIVR